MISFPKNTRPPVVMAFVAEALSGKTFAGHPADRHGNGAMVLRGKTYTVTPAEASAGVVATAEHLDRVRGSAEDLSANAQFRTFKYVLAAGMSVPLADEVKSEVVPYLAETTFGALAHAFAQGDAYDERTLRRMQDLSLQSPPTERFSGRDRKLAKIYANDTRIPPEVAFKGIVSEPYLTRYISPAERMTMLGRLEQAEIPSDKLFKLGAHLREGADVFGVSSVVRDWVQPLNDMAMAKWTPSLPPLPRLV